MNILIIRHSASHLAVRVHTVLPAAPNARERAPP